MWNCRKELVLWCNCKMKIIVTFFGKGAILEKLGFRRVCVLELVL